VFAGEGVEGPVGRWDPYIVLAERYQWTPAEVQALDPDYLEELMARLAAEADHEEAERQTRERQERQAARRREQAGRTQRAMGGGWAVEEAEVE